MEEEKKDISSPGTEKEKSGNAPEDDLAAENGPQEHEPASEETKAGEASSGEKDLVSAGEEKAESKQTESPAQDERKPGPHVILDKLDEALEAKKSSGEGPASEQPAGVEPEKEEGLAPDKAAGAESHSSTSAQKEVFILDEGEPAAPGDGSSPSSQPNEPLPAENTSGTETLEQISAAQSPLSQGEVVSRSPADLASADSPEALISEAMQKLDNLLKKVKEEQISPQKGGE